MDKYYVYLYTHHNIPRYVGKGYGRRYRVQEHMYCYAPQHPLFRYINKHKDEIQASFLIENVSEKEAFYWEQFWIATLGRKINNTGPLLNITAGGEGEAGAVQSKEWIDRRLAARKLHNNFKHSEETKQKIKNTLMGRKMPEEQRLKLIGRQMSNITRKKMSESHKGKRGYWYNKKASVETKNKMSIEQRGSKNAAAKIDERIVISMRLDYCNNHVSVKRFAEVYNISESQVRKIINRKAWKHI